MHWHEDGISSSQSDEEVNLPPSLVHHPPKHFREPVIRSRKHAKDRRHAHDQMKVPDHKISVVQLNIEHRLRQERSTQSARNKQRHKSNGIEHRSLKANSPLIHRPQPVKRL